MVGVEIVGWKIIQGLVHLGGGAPAGFAPRAPGAAGAAAARRPGRRARDRCARSPLRPRGYSIGYVSLLLTDSGRISRGNSRGVWDSAPGSTPTPNMIVMPVGASDLIGSIAFVCRRRSRAAR